MPANSNGPKQWSGQTEIPRTACIFQCDDAIQFAAGDEKDSVRLVGYRGDIIDHWYWGNLAFDMGGLRFAKKATPGLIDHWPSQRLTFSKEQGINPEVFIAGPILDNEDAQKVKVDMAKGFQFEASLSLTPTLVEQVAKGESVKVNGHVLKGPGAVFRKAAIREISATVFGAFSNTESALYSDTENPVNFTLVDKEKPMPKTQESTEMTVADMTIETFAAARADLHTAIVEKSRAEGATAEKERFAGIVKACGDDHALAIKCFTEGKSPTEAMSLRNEALTAANTELAATNAELAGNQESGVDPAEQEFRDGAPAPGTETSAAGEGDEASWRLAFAASKELRAEFRMGGVEAYIETMKREAADAA